MTKSGYGAATAHLALVDSLTCPPERISDPTRNTISAAGGTTPTIAEARVANACPRLGGDDGGTTVSAYAADGARVSERAPSV
jgi:hypothetical protein